jgi:hypothetical protein
MKNTRKNSKRQAILTSYRIGTTVTLIAILVIVLLCLMEARSLTKGSAIAEANVEANVLGVGTVYKPFFMHEEVNIDTETAEPGQTETEEVASLFDWLTSSQIEAFTGNANFVDRSLGSERFISITPDVLARSPHILRWVLGEELMNIVIEMTDPNWRQDGDKRVFLSEIRIYPYEAVELSLWSEELEGVHNYSDVRYKITCQYHHDFGALVNFETSDIDTMYSQSVYSINYGQSFNEGIPFFVETLKQNPEFWTELRKGEDGKISSPD